MDGIGPMMRLYLLGPPQLGRPMEEHEAAAGHNTLSIRVVYSG